MTKYSAVGILVRLSLLSARKDAAGRLRAVWTPPAVFCLLALAVSGAQAFEDIDGDGVDDPFDNCVQDATHYPNPEQTNADFDQFGNVCDGDLNLDGVVNGDDLTLLERETDAGTLCQDHGRCRVAADLNEDGAVDGGDVTYFQSFPAAPGPAGDQAHKDDPSLFTRNFCQRSLFDQCMAECVYGVPQKDEDTCVQVDCAHLVPHPFRHRAPWVPDHADNLIQNSRLEALPGQSFPDGWTTTPTAPSESDIAFQTDVNRSAEQEDGSFRWYAWRDPGFTYAKLLAPTPPAPETIDPSRSYVLSFFMCTAEWPPSGSSISVEEFDDANQYLGKVYPTGGGGMNSQPGVWEELNATYRPSSSAVRRIKVRITAGKGPDGTRGSFWIDDFALFELPDNGTPLHRQPSAEKLGFDGARVKIDALGNIDVLEDDQWKPFFVFGIYGEYQRQDFTFYSDQGFNVILNETHTGARASRAGPAGMRWMMQSQAFWPDQWDAGLKETLETNLGDYWDTLLGFFYDNEIFTECPNHRSGDPKAVADEDCLETMWERQEDRQATIFALDREQNGGERGVPSVYLNGSTGVARTYASAEIHGEVEIGGQTQPFTDKRMDATGGYGPFQVDHLERSSGQRAPVSMVLVSAQQANRFRSRAWAGVALGAKMIATWRDFSTERQNSRHAWMGAEITLCGSSNFGFTERTTQDGSQGTIIRGCDTVQGCESGGARAEILLRTGDYSACPGGEDGAKYIAHMKDNGDPDANFRVNDQICREDGGCPDPIPGATVRAVPTSFVVDYMIPIEKRVWWNDYPELKDDILALEPIIRESHWTEWAAECHGVVDADGQQVVAQFGDEGYVCGTRTHDGEGYIFVANTWVDVDRYGAFQHQYVGKPMTMTITVENLGYYPARYPEFFDFETNTWEQEHSTWLHRSGDAWTFTFNLDPLEAAAIKLAPPACNDGIDNDEDGDVDFPDDNGCHSVSDLSEGPDCSDGIDNDRDGNVDFPSDGGCVDAGDPGEGLEEWICFDGIDNDGDGYMDMYDPGCRVKTQGYEDPQCDDDVDNDGDGFIDLADPECQGYAWWPDESTTCGLGWEFALVLPGLMRLRRTNWRGVIG